MALTRVVAWLGLVGRRSRLRGWPCWWPDVGRAVPGRGRGLVGRRRAAASRQHGRNYRQRYESLVRPVLGELRLREITVGRLDAFMAGLQRRGLAIETLRNVRTV